ncbi:MAG: D-alanine--D-alanine ligase [Candidatus Paceibacterota bacterium]
MGKKIKIGVLMGGPSSEHDVSLSTGENVFNTLDRKKFSPYKAILSKDWGLSVGGKKTQFPAGLKKFDVVFNALHGVVGEDGVIQTILELVGVPYTGSNAAASYLGMDKWLSYEIFKKSGLAVPKTELITQYSRRGQASASGAVLKPRRGGSSLGVEILRSKDEFKNKLMKVLKYDSEVILQEYLSGREFTCGILEKNGKAIALPVIETRAVRKSTFFDYEAKYTPGMAEEIVPAEISKDLEKKIKNASMKAHEAIGCRSYSRSDFIVKNGKPYILEINTLPGLTKNSLIPKAANSAGISLPELLEVIISDAINR